MPGWVLVSASPWTRGAGCSEEAPGAEEPEVTNQEEEEEEEDETGQESGMLGRLAVVGGLEEPASCRRVASLSRQYQRRRSGRGQSYQPPSRSDASSCQPQPRLLLEERRESLTWAAPQHQAGEGGEAPEILAEVSWWW